MNLVSGDAAVRVRRRAPRHGRGRVTRDNRRCCDRIGREATRLNMVLDACGTQCGRIHRCIADGAVVEVRRRRVACTDGDRCGNRGDVDTDCRCAADERSVPEDSNGASVEREGDVLPHVRLDEPRRRDNG